jgi:hypothetical protein
MKLEWDNQGFHCHGEVVTRLNKKHKISNSLSKQQSSTHTYTNEQLFGNSHTHSQNETGIHKIGNLLRNSQN